jgi:hypothetical protein
MRQLLDDICIYILSSTIISSTKAALQVISRTSIPSPIPNHLHKSLSWVAVRQGKGLRSSVREVASTLLTPRRPPPPPRVSRKLGSTTIRRQDLPPVITKTAEAGILVATALKASYLMEDHAGCEPSAVESTTSHLESLADQAQKACNVRDYITLLIEATLVRLVLDAGPPVPAILDLARAVNPFLNRQDESGAGTERSGLGESSAAGARAEQVLPSPFRATDVAYITEAEKDLLVLLYYCDLVNLRGSADEVVDHVVRMADKHGNIKELDVRKEALTETEVLVICCRPPSHRC